MTMAALSSPRCLFNPPTALRRVFSLYAVPVPPARHLPPARRHVPSPSHHHQTRTYAAAPPRRVPRGHRSIDQADGGVAADDRGFSPLFTTAQDIERSKKDRMPQDFEIKDPKIMVLENGSIAGPLSTRYVLSKLDTKTESLRMIRPYVPKGAPDAARRSKGKVDDAAEEEEGGEAKVAAVTQQEQFALCEIVDKLEALQRERERKERRKAATAARPRTKEMELTWSIGEHDLQTKMRQLGGFLGRGCRVQLVLGSKRGSGKVEEAAMRALVRRVQEEARGLGAREVAPAKGELGRTMRMQFEGVVKKQT